MHNYPQLYLIKPQGGHSFFIKNPSTFQYIMLTPKSDNQYISVHFTQENHNVPQIIYVGLTVNGYWGWVCFHPPPCCRIFFLWKISAKCNFWPCYQILFANFCDINFCDINFCESLILKRFCDTNFCEFVENS